MGRRTRTCAAPGYGPGTRPNANAHRTCVRGFHGCGAFAGVYCPATQKQLGRKKHSTLCGAAWKASGSTSLVGAHAHRKRMGPVMPAGQPDAKKRAAGSEPEPTTCATAAAQSHAAKRVTAPATVPTADERAEVQRLRALFASRMAAEAAVTELPDRRSHPWLDVALCCTSVAVARAFADAGGQGEVVKDTAQLFEKKLPTSAVELLAPGLPLLHKMVYIGPLVTFRGSGADPNRTVTFEATVVRAELKYVVKTRLLRLRLQLANTHYAENAEFMRGLSFYARHSPFAAADCV